MSARDSPHPLPVSPHPLSHPLVSLVAQANADEVKVRVSKEEAQVGEIAKEAQAIAADAQRDLDEAMPCQAT